MAKKKKTGRKKATVSKSQAVRDYLKSKPKAMPVDVSEALKKKGLDVAPSLVSQVKYQMKPEGAKSTAAPKAPRKKKSAAKAKTAKAKSAKLRKGLTANDLLKVKELADQLGGQHKLQEAIQILRRLA
jgi:hypothetical protein